MMPTDRKTQWRMYMCDAKALQNNESFEKWLKKAEKNETFKYM